MKKRLILELLRVEVNKADQLLALSPTDFLV
jgi:hypothetical protein